MLAWICGSWKLIVHRSWLEGACSTYKSFTRHTDRFVIFRWLHYLWNTLVHSFKIKYEKINKNFNQKVKLTTYPLRGSMLSSISSVRGLFLSSSSFSHLSIYSFSGVRLFIKPYWFGVGVAPPMVSGVESPIVPGVNPTGVFESQLLLLFFGVLAVINGVASVNRPGVGVSPNLRGVILFTGVISHIDLPWGVLDPIPVLMLLLKLSNLLFLFLSISEFGFLSILSVTSCLSCSRSY